MAMHWLVQGCSYGDSLVFHFSGLGAQVADDDGDEVDGYDEALCPMDAFQKGPILDDEINEVMVRPLVHGARLHAVVDACYSATVLDLPFLCRIGRNGYPQWEDHRPPSGAWKGTSGGQAVLFSGYSDGKINFAVVSDDPYICKLPFSYLALSSYLPQLIYLLYIFIYVYADAGCCRLGGGHDAQLYQGGGVRAARDHLRPPAELHEGHHEGRRRRRELRRDAGALRRRAHPPAAPGRQLQRRPGEPRSRIHS
jgi:hypothetical protein